MTIMNFKKWAGRSCGAALLVTSVGACDFIEVSGSNPNVVPSASADQLFTAIQANTFFFAESQIARLSSLWIQQMAGTDRQFQILDQYSFGEDALDGEMAAIYTGGGLIDIRRAISKAEEANRQVYAGILKIHEAYLVGMGASIWGDIIYSQAVDQEQFPTPELDEQAAVYAAVQALLDEAIADLQTGSGAFFPGSVDFNFSGDASRWTAVANTLKARFYIHWAKAQQQGSALATTACGGDCVQKAITAAQSGIMTSAGSWTAKHSQSSTAANFWHQFLRDRSGYISGGAYLINSLNNGTPSVFADDDPRLAIYFTEGSGDFEGQYIGSPPGSSSEDPGVNSSQLNVPGEADFPQPIMTCAENQFILAEAQVYAGNDAAAQAALGAALACEEARLGVTLPDPSPLLLGQDLLEEIITQKYIALFLNMEVWNDWKRTCLPDIQPLAGSEIPRRPFYGQSERQTNPNIPEPSQQPSRNDNDPQGCTSA
jgi:hypothetical protein